MNRTMRLLALVIATPLLTLGAQAVRVTSADYDRASAQLAPSLAGLVTGGTVAANWLPDDRFWYRTGAGASAQTVLVDPAKKTRVVCDATRSNCPGVPENANADPAGRGGRLSARMSKRSKAEEISSVPRPVAACTSSQEKP